MPLVHDAGGRRDGSLPEVRVASAASARVRARRQRSAARVRKGYAMERCYVCNHCGKCDDRLLLIPIDEVVCLDCGHVVEPGESRDACRVCGSKNLGTRSVAQE